MDSDNDTRPKSKDERESIKKNVLKNTSSKKKKNAAIVDDGERSDTRDSKVVDDQDDDIEKKPKVGAKSPFTDEQDAFIDQKLEEFQPAVLDGDIDEQTRIRVEAWPEFSKRFPDIQAQTAGGIKFSKAEWKSVSNFKP